MIIVSDLMPTMTPIIGHFFKTTPKELPIGFKLKNPGKWSKPYRNIRLLWAHKYLGSSHKDIAKLL
jgi:hypothetical protein